MKKAHVECDQSLIDRFFDGELGRDEYDRVRKHLEGCPTCQKALQDNQVISTLFRASLDGEISRAGLDRLGERVLDLVRQEKVPWWRRFAEHFVLRRLLIPATAVALVGLFLIIERGPVSIPDPSAIVKSFSGETLSVMIIEAPKSRQTIIWYKETS